MSDRIYYSKEAERLARQRRTTIALLAAAVGIGAGAVMALMFAPHHAAERRAMLKDALQDTYKHGRKSAQKSLKDLEIRDTMEDLLHRVHA
jgi:hypothetical protein